MKALYEEVIREIKEVSGYLEWVEQGGEELYGKREQAARWYHALLEIASEIVQVVVGEQAVTLEQAVT